MESEAQPSKPDTRSAELPDDVGKSDPAPETTENRKPSGREDREAVPPVRRAQTEALKDQQENQAEEDISEKLAKLEKPIDSMNEAMVEAAPNIALITEEGLHRARGYDSIGTYADERFGISRQRWYQLAGCGEVLDQLRSKQTSTAVDTPLPCNEAQTRPLQSYRGDEDFLWKAWTKALEEYGPKPRRTDVEDVVDELNLDDSGSDSSGEEEDSREPTREESEEETPSTDNSGGSPTTRGDSTSTPEEIGDTDADENSEESSSTEEPSEPESSGEFDIDGSGNVDTPWSSESSGDQFSPTKDDIEDLGQKVEQDEEGFCDSSSDRMVASKVWKALVPSPIGAGAGLPEEPSQDEDPVGAVLKPGRLDQITSLAEGHDGERVLVCPGVDLFAKVVPDSAIAAILDRCRKTDHKPVVFTRHLGRASDFDLSDLWVGTPADHSCHDDKAQALSDAAPDAAVQWLLYDVENQDKEDPPTFSDETDWVVYDPPGDTGVSLTVSETQSLVEAAEESDVDWSFRSAFKTCGDSGPSEEDADEDTD